VARAVGCIGPAESAKQTQCGMQAKQNKAPVATQPRSMEHARPSIFGSIRVHRCSSAAIKIKCGFPPGTLKIIIIGRRSTQMNADFG
jgi:hypothetical protein